MSSNADDFYGCDELFEYVKSSDPKLGGYELYSFLKNDDPFLTELEIPAEFNGEPITEISKECFIWAEYLNRVVVPPSVRVISSGAFYMCSSLESTELSEGLETINSQAFMFSALKSIRLPKSLKNIMSEAFRCCGNLERVEFNSVPTVGFKSFSNCPKLPPETVIMGLVGSADITTPIWADPYGLLGVLVKYPNKPLDCFRPDVFELLLKNGNLKNCCQQHFLKQMILENKPELFPLAEQYGMMEALENAQSLDELINEAIEQKNTLITAYLLDYKNRKFGFEGFGEGDNFEL